MSSPCIAHPLLETAPEHNRHAAAPGMQDKLGLLVFSRPSDGARLQYVWRYQAAANKWDIIHSRKYAYNAQGRLSSTIASLSATNGTALWASWEGECNRPTPLCRSSEAGAIGE